MLALTAVLAWQATAALVDGELRLSDEAQRWRTLDLAFARIEADLRQALPRAVRTPSRHANRPGSRRPKRTARARSCSRAPAPSSTRSPGRPGQRIGYRIRDAALEVVYWPTLDRSRDESVAYRLVDGVAGFRVEHLASTGQWVAAWPRLRRDRRCRAPCASLLTLASGETIERWFALQ